MGYAITVEFTLKTGSMAAFRKLMDRNAMDSLDLEPGCRRFDVLVPLNSTDKIFLYEIYANRAAFDAHLKTDHFKVFNRDSSAMITDRKISEFELVYEASPKTE